jgi:hypothetical protein
MVESSVVAEPITGTLTCSDDSDQVSAAAWNLNRSCTAAGPLAEVRDGTDGTAYRVFSQAGHTTTAGSVTYGVSAFSAATNSGAIVAASFAAAAPLPTLTSATVDSATATTFTLGAEYTQDSTEYAVAMPVGYADPTDAQIIAGTGATGVASNAQTADTPDTYGLTPSHTLKHPIYDIHRVASNAGGNSVVTRHYDQALDPPAGKQFSTVTGIPWGLSITAATATNPPEVTVAESLVTEDWDSGDIAWFWEFTGGWAALNAEFNEPTQDWLGRTITVTGTHTFTVDIDATAFGAWSAGGFAATTRSLFEAASPAVANGDIAVLDLVTTPDSYPITPLPGGAVGIDSGGSTAQQTFSTNVFDVSAADYYGEIAVAHQNPGPILNGDLGEEAFEITLEVGAAAIEIDLRNYASDPNDEALVFAEDASSANSFAEAGITIDGYTAQFDPALALANGSVTIRVTDAVGQYALFTFAPMLYGVRIPDVLGETQAAGTAELEGDGFVVAVGSATRSSAYPDIGDIARTSPVAGGIVEDGSTVTIHVSLGPGKGVGRPFCFSWWES